MKKRVALLVYVDLNPIPGTFHTDEAALTSVAGILDNQIGHYNPIVAHAPDELQPPNRPSKLSDTQEIPTLVGFVHPEVNGVMHPADIQAIYTKDTDNS